MRSDLSKSEDDKAREAEEARKLEETKNNSDT